MKTYLSLGAGVDTTAILLMPDIMEQTDFVIFADTGGENPEIRQRHFRIIRSILFQFNSPLPQVRMVKTEVLPLIQSLEWAIITA